ncbi:hypothetical protein [Spirosoma sp. 209]|uniref:hypothetical protein n=1 Tax=Spirosoma sp. 209 TaxID=1955701 RepID=UPI00098D257D|nr:hypothetical protein [Spirosoma sp. 209]
MQNTDNFDPDADPMIQASRRSFQTRKRIEQAEALVRFQGSPLTWKARYDRMKAYYGMADQQVADITGLSAGSIRTVVNSKKQDFPRWLKLVIWVFETETGLNQGATVNL